MEWTPLAMVTDTEGNKCYEATKIVYVRPLHVKTGHSEVRIRQPMLVITRIKRMMYRPGSGFAQVGNSIRIEAENGAVFEGDSENQGWDFLKLEQD